MKVPRLASLAAAAALAAGTAAAHHTASRFDSSRTVTVQGVVTRFDWANPHVYVYLEQTTETGARVEWEVEGQPPSIMRRAGWSRDTLRVGDAVTVSGNPSRSATTRSLLPTAIRSGERTLYDRGQAMKQMTAAAATPATGARGLEGTWTTQLALKLTGRLAAPDPSKLTPEGAAALARYDETTMHPALSCIAFSAPTLMITPDLKRITMSGGTIVIEGEFDGAKRVIHMGATHEGAAPSIQGHSIGRWEGSSLVIDTTHFAYHAVGNGLGVPSGSRKHMAERLTPAADGKRLTYHFELNDAEFLAEPIVADVEWVFSPAAKFEPARCVLENARRFARD